MAGRYGNGRGGRPWRRKVEAVKLRDQYTCQACGRITDDGEVDHVVAISKGGSDDLSNLAWLCREPCHADKSARERGQTPKTVYGEDGWPLTDPRGAGKA